MGSIQDKIDLFKSRLKMHEDNWRKEDPGSWHRGYHWGLMQECLLIIQELIALNSEIEELSHTRCGRLPPIRYKPLHTKPNRPDGV